MNDCIIVIPCYNEAARLNTYEFQRFVAQGHSIRFLLVNDGSTDDTRSILLKLRDWDADRFEVYDLPRNSGKAEAVRRGILHALASGAAFVGFWDADLATPLDEIPRFVQLLKGNTRLRIVLGARVRLLGRTIERRRLRQFLGRVFATAAAAVLGLPVYDTQCGAKMFRASADIRQLFEQPFVTNWIFDVELLARWVQGAKAKRWEASQESIYELPLNTWRDVAGSKVRSTDFVKAIYELAQIYGSYLSPAAVPQGRERNERKEPASRTGVDAAPGRRAA